MKSSVSLRYFVNNDCRYLVLEAYFSPHKRNIVCKYKLHGKPVMKLKHTFSFVSDIDVEY